jgi:SAM-dependent methyltransferase
MLARMEAAYRHGAEQMRAQLASSSVTPAGFHAALTRVPPEHRDAWVDEAFGLEAIADDGPALPRGCVPYLPCPVDALLRVVEHARVRSSDVLVDIGSGVGRAAALVHLLTGASAIGLEIQPALVAASRDLAARLGLRRVAFVEGDAAALTGRTASGSVFFLYCPFSGTRLEAVLDDLEPIARTREIRVGCVDLPLPARPWLELASPPAGDVAVYRSTQRHPGPR